MICLRLWAKTIKNNLVAESAVNLKPALGDFFKALVVSILLRNGDAHLKNFGLLYKDTMSMINLAPIYDIVTTQAYLPNDIMALTLNGTKRWANKKDLLSFAGKSCMLSKVETTEIFDHVILAIEQTLELLSTEIERNASFRHVGLQMMTIWRQAVATFSNV